MNRAARGASFLPVTTAFERSEADAFLALVNAADPDVRRRHDVEATTIGGVAVLSRPGPDMAFWCQAVGFEAPPAAGLIEEIVGHYRARGVELARFILPPWAETPEWPAIAAKYGMVAGGGGLKLASTSPSSTPSTPSTSSLRTARVGLDDAERWATLMWGIFGMGSEADVELAVAALRRPEFEAYACWDGDEMVATGLVRLSPASAHLFSGATLPAYRGRGAQSALITARVEAARRSGCPMLVAETGVAPDGYNDSARNLMRAGFIPQYERRTWIWSA